MTSAEEPYIICELLAIPRYSPKPSVSHCTASCLLLLKARLFVNAAEESTCYPTKYKTSSFCRHYASQTNRLGGGGESKQKANKISFTP